VNLTGVFYCMRAQLRVMKGPGSIVNAASTAGLEGYANNANYTTSKHGVIGLRRSGAKEVGKKGIRVNAVAPGLINTPIAATAANTAPDMNANLTCSGAYRATGRGGRFDCFSSK